MGYPSIEHPGVTPFTIMLVLITAVVIPTLFIHPWRVMKHQQEKGEDWIGALIYLIPFYVIMFCIFNYATFSPIAWKKHGIITVSGRMDNYVRP